MKFILSLFSLAIYFCCSWTIPSLAEDTSSSKGVSPDRKTNFVANIYWQSAYISKSSNNTVKPVLDVIYDRPLSFVWQSSALGTCLYQEDQENHTGFHLDGSGCYFGGYLEKPVSFRVGGSIGVQNVKAHENNGYNEVASSYLCASSLVQAFFAQGRVIFCGQSTLSLGSHNLNHPQKGLLGGSYGTFNSRTNLSSFAIYTPIQAKTNGHLTITPFVRFQCIASEQESFEEEKNPLKRVFVMPDTFFDISIPFGINNKLIIDGLFPSIWELEISYNPSIARNDGPLVGSFLTKDNQIFISAPTPVSKRSCSFHLKNETRISSGTSVNFNYLCDLSSSTRSHYLLAGGKLSF